MKTFYTFLFLLGFSSITAPVTAHEPRVSMRQCDGTYRDVSLKKTSVSESDILKTISTNQSDFRLMDGGSGSGSGSGSGGDSDDGFTVRCSYQWNPDKWMLEYMTAVNTSGTYDGEYHPYDYTQGPTPIPVDYVDVEVPEGTYDFVGQFAHMNPEYRYGYDYEIFVIKENIDVYTDTALTFNPDEATVHIKIVTYNPDGSVSTLPKGEQVLEDKYEEKIPGNITMALVQTQVYHDSYGKVLGRISELTGDITSGDYGITDGFASVDFYVNPVSDKYTFFQIRLMPAAEKGVYVAPVWQRGAKEGTISNSVASYVDCTQKFLTSPAGVANPAGKDIDYAVYTPVIFAGSESEMAIGIGGGTETTLKVMCSDAELGDVSKPVGGFYSLQARYTDAAVANEAGSSSSSGDKAIYTTIGATLNPFGQEYPSYLYFPVGNLRYWPGGSLFPLNPYPGAEGFITPMEGCSFYNGSTAPLLVSNLIEQWSPYLGFAIPYFYSDYIGWLGEERKSDAVTLQTKLYENDKLIDEGSDAMIDWSWFYKQEDAAKMRVELTNSNFEIDGLRGGNTAIVQFDMTLENHTPPSLTMLQTRDAAGNGTNRFETAADMNLLLSAADMSIAFGEDNSWGAKSVWFDYSVPATIKAEIAPYGTTDFVEIPLTERPDLFDNHGFGAFYTGSAPSLTTTGEKGWFDIKVTVSDASGNSQQQTISPAVQIKDLTSGISTVNTDTDGRLLAYSEGTVRISDEATHVSVYTASGIEVMRARRGATLLDLTPLPAGVYVVKASSANADTTLKIAR